MQQVVVADFDNDGLEEIVLINRASSSDPQPNILLSRVRSVTDCLI